MDFVYTTLNFPGQNLRNSENSGDLFHPETSMNRTLEDNTISFKMYKYNNACAIVLNKNERVTQGIKYRPP
jgi:hypothetical protein